MATFSRYQFAVRTAQNRYPSPRGLRRLSSILGVDAKPRPTNLVPAISLPHIVLTWDAVINAISYNIYRSTAANGTFTILGSTALATYTDSGAAVSVNNYWYKVSAINQYGESILEGPVNVGKGAVRRTLNHGFDG